MDSKHPCHNRFNIIPSKHWNDPHWKEYGIVVEEPQKGEREVTIANFPEGWTYCHIKGDTRHTYYYDPQKVPRIYTFINSLNYDNNPVTSFLPEEHIKDSEQYKKSIIARYGMGSGLF
jgi:hypothetical protein